MNKRPLKQTSYFVLMHLVIWKLIVSQEMDSVRVTAGILTSPQCITMFFCCFQTAETAKKMYLFTCWTKNKRRCGSRRDWKNGVWWWACDRNSVGRIWSQEAGPQRGQGTPWRAEASLRQRQRYCAVTCPGQWWGHMWGLQATQVWFQSDSWTWWSVAYTDRSETYEPEPDRGGHFPVGLKTIPEGEL